MDWQSIFDDTNGKLQIQSNGTVYCWFSHSHLPNMLCATSIPLSSPGTPTDKPPWTSVEGVWSESCDLTWQQLTSQDNVNLITSPMQDCMSWPHPFQSMWHHLPPTTSASVLLEWYISAVAAPGAVSLKLMACAEPFVSYTTMNPPLRGKRVIPS